MVALNRRACVAAATCFQNRTVSKYYLALVRGHVSADQLIDVQVPVGVDIAEQSLSNRMSTGEGRCVGGSMKGARTQMLVIERGVFTPDGYPATKVLLKLITGRRHQLRVHCSHLGHTIVGDYTYSNRRDTKPPRTFLHSFRLVLKDGVECIDVSTGDPFVSACVWTPVEVVNCLDADAFRQLETPALPLQTTITS
ncbi:RNA pseudouridylate synthase domain-containing protein 1-like isoform X2 [Nilaparvata lugens]|nr:RNA pseudouridylate synthase domain-containing protein 1-like isoform X2 [Nilaparvata lugens]